MNRKRILALAISVLAILGGGVIYAQDTGQAKYSVRVPNGLAFSEFRGYEGWQTVAISHNEKASAVILANPEMIKAYQSGIPGNGKPFPDGSKMAKIHWNPKKQEAFPNTTVPGSLHDVDFMVKDSKRFATAADGDGVRSSITPRPTRSRRPARTPSRRRATTPSVGSRVTRSRRHEITCSRNTGSDDRNAGTAPSLGPMISSQPTTTRYGWRDGDDTD